MDHDAAAKTRYFDGLAPRWDTIMGGAEERISRLQSIFSSIRLSPGYRVIDAGCGTGILFSSIEEKIGPSGIITALDPSPVMIRHAKEGHTQYKNIEYLVSTLEEARFVDGGHDAALCFAVIPHLESIAAGLAVVRRALKPEGRLYIFHLDDTETLNRFHGGLDAPVKHDILPAEMELKDILSAARFRVLTYIDRPGLNFVESAAC